MKLGISTLLWYDQSPIEAKMRFLAEEGITEFEIRRCPHHLDYASPHGARRLLSAMKRYGVSAYSLHVPDTLCSDVSVLDRGRHEAALSEIMAAAATLREIGGHMIVLHAGGVLEDESERERRLDIACRQLRSLGRHCERLGLRVAVENSLPTRIRVGDKPGEIVRLVERIDERNVGICFDTSHANIGGDLLQGLRTVGGRLIHMHVSDNQGQQDEHALPFRGNIDWREVMAWLRGSAYDGMLMFELRSDGDERRMLREAKAAYGKLVEMSGSPSETQVPEPGAGGRVCELE